jgi:hypothetical protein
MTYNIFFAKSPFAPEPIILLLYVKSCDSRSLLKAVYETVNAVTDKSDPTSNHKSGIYPNSVGKELYTKARYMLNRN